MDAYLAKQVRYLYGIEIRVSTTGRYYRFTPPLVPSGVSHYIIGRDPCPSIWYTCHLLHACPCPTPAPRLVYLCSRLAEGMLTASITLLTYAYGLLYTIDNIKHGEI